MGDIAQGQIERKAGTRIIPSGIAILAPHQDAGQIGEAQEAMNRGGQARFELIGNLPDNFHRRFMRSKQPMDKKVRQKELRGKLVRLDLQAVEFPVPALDGTAGTGSCCAFVARNNVMEVVIAARNPWQTPYVEMFPCFPARPRPQPRVWDWWWARALSLQLSAVSF